MFGESCLICLAWDGEKSYGKTRTHYCDTCICTSMCIALPLIIIFTNTGLTVLDLHSWTVVNLCSLDLPLLRDQFSNTCCICSFYRVTLSRRICSSAGGPSLGSAVVGAGSRTGDTVCRPLHGVSVVGACRRPLSRALLSSCPAMFLLLSRTPGPFPMPTLRASLSSSERPFAQRYPKSPWPAYPTELLLRRFQIHTKMQFY